VLRAALVGLLPAVLTIVLLHGLVGGAISQYVPTISDDVSYWHQIATAREHGVHGGRYTYEEQKPLGPSHFGAWGPVYPLVMAAITSPFAWNLSTPPIFAIALFAIMLAIGTFMTNPRGWRLVALMAVVATSWPVYLALPTALQESFHMALGVLLATGLVVLAQRRDESRAVRLLTGGCLILVLLLASIRPVWAYMVFPALLLGRPRLTIRNMLAILGITAVVALLALALTVTMAAPYPYEDNPAIVIRAAHGLTGKVSAVLDNMGTNWKILTGKRVYLRSFTVTSLAGLTLVIWHRNCACHFPVSKRRRAGQHDSRRIGSLGIRLCHGRWRGPRRPGADFVCRLQHGTEHATSWPAPLAGVGLRGPASATKMARVDRGQHRYSAVGGHKFSARFS